MDSNFAVICVSKDSQQLLVVHEVFRNQDGTTFFYCSRKLPKNARPRLTRKIMRSHWCPSQGTNRRVLRIKIVYPRRSLAKKLSCSVTYQLVDGSGEKSNYMGGALKVL